MIAAMADVAPVANENSHHVRFDIEADRIVMTAKSDRCGESSSEIPLAHSEGTWAGGISMALNCQYVADAMRILGKGERIRMMGTGGDRAIVLTTPSEAVRVVQMPMQLE